MSTAVWRRGILSVGVLATLGLVSVASALAQSQVGWQRTGCRQGYHVKSLVSSGDAIVAGLWGVGVAINRGGGDGWREEDAGGRATYVTACALGPDGDVFVGTHFGAVLLGRDYGTQWEELEVAGTLGTVYALALLGGALLIGTDKGLYSYDPATLATVELAAPELREPIYSIRVVGDTVLLGGLGRVTLSADRLATIATSERFAESAVLDVYFDKKKIIASTLGRFMYVAKKDVTAGWSPLRNAHSTAITYATLEVDGVFHEATDARGVVEGGAETKAGAETMEVTTLCLFGGRIYAGTVRNGVIVRTTKQNLVIGNQTDDEFEANASVLEAKLTVAPNPAQTYADVFWTDSDEVPHQLYLHDAGGRTVMMRQVYNGNYTLQVADLPSGTYTITLTGPNGSTLAQQLIISR